MKSTLPSNKAKTPKKRGSDQWDNQKKVNETKMRMQLDWTVIYVRDTNNLSITIKKASKIRAT